MWLKTKKTKKLKSILLVLFSLIFFKVPLHDSDTEPDLINFLNFSHCGFIYLSHVRREFFEDFMDFVKEISFDETI